MSTSSEVLTLPLDSSRTLRMRLNRSLDSGGGDGGDNSNWEGDNSGDIANSGRTSNSGPLTREIVWEVNNQTDSGGGVAGAALISGGRLFFGSADSAIRCLGTRNGTSLWTTRVGAGAISSSPILLNDVLYVGSEDSSLYALNATTGALLWSTAPDQQPVYATPVLIPPFALDPSVSVYSVLLTSGKHVRALAIQSASDDSVLAGDELWRYSVTWNSAQGKLRLRSTPAVNLKTGRVFFSTGPRQSVVAINLNNGTLIWEKGLLTNVRSSPALDTYGDRQRVYVTSALGLHALGQKGGRKVWLFADGGGQSSPALSNDSSTIFFGSTDKAVYAVDESGAMTWSFPTSSAITSSSPVLDAQGALYIGSDGGVVYAINSTTGAQKWQLQANGGITAAPVISRAGQLFVGAADGTMIGVGAPQSNAAPSPSPPGSPPTSDYRPDQKQGPLNKTSLSDGALAAVVILSILGGTAIIAIVLFVMRRRSKEGRDNERSATAAAWEMANLQAAQTSSPTPAPTPGHAPRAPRPARSAATV